MSALGNYVVAITLDQAGYAQGVNKTQSDTLRLAAFTEKSMQSMERSVQSYINRVVGIGAAYLSFSSVFDSINKQVDALAQLDDAAQKTGASVELLSKIQKTAVAFGEDFGGKIEPAITKLAKGIAGLDDPTNKANAALKALGIQARDANGQFRDAAQITIDVAKALQGYRDDASKTALAIDLFGKSGAEAMPFLNDLAENVDKFSTVSAEAAGNAAALQDSINLQKQYFDQFVQQLTISVLPALNDMAGAFVDVQKSGRDLANDKSVLGWADNLALTLAPAYDTLVNMKNELKAIIGSFGVVGADISVAGAYISRLFGKINDPRTGIEDVLARREGMLKDANQWWADAVNRPRDEYEAALRARIASRPNKYASPNTATDKADLPSVGYLSGQDAKDATAAQKAASEAEAAKKAYDTLTDSINKQIEAKRAEYSVTGPLSEAEKALLDVNLKRADGQLKLTDAQYANVKSLLDTLEAETRSAEMSKIRLQAEQDYLTLIEQTTAARGEIYTTMQDETTALEELAKAKVDELDQMRMTKAEIDALNMARYDEQIGILETQKAYLESQPERENEIELIERQIEALKTLRGTVGQAEAINKSKAEVDAMFGSMENAARLVWTVFANSGENAAKAAGAAIKASILDLLYQMTIKKFLIQVQASISPGGTINNLTGPITGNPNASIIDQIADGFKSINTTFTSSIEKLGAFLSNGQGGLADKIGGFLGQYSSQIASGISYLGAGYMLSQGNIAGAALTAAGTYFVGPIGGAIGGAIGSLFGKKKSTPRYSSGVDTSYVNGQFSSTDLYGLAGFKKDAGGRDGLAAASKVFSETLSGLLSAFDINSSINTQLQFFKRKGAWGFASATIDGISSGSIGGDSVYSKDAQEAFNNLINQFLTTGIVNAIKVTKLPEGIKSLFNDLTDQTQISNMITASVNLANNQDALAKSYNLSADLAGKVAVASGLAGDSLVAFVNSLTSASLSQQSAAATLIKERDALAEKIGLMPTTLSAFDAMLKTIDATTADGQQKFADLFSARDRVSSWSSAIDAIKVASDNAKFSLLSQSEQMAISQQKLAEAFAEVNAVVPGSRDELIKWINTLDLTKEADLKAAMAVPALVEAFQAIEDQANSLTNSLRDMGSFTSLADYRFYKGVANNYGNQVANDYAGVSRLLGSNAAGQTTLNGESIADLKQLLADLRDTTKQALVVQRNTQTALEQIQARGLKTV